MLKNKKNGKVMDLQTLWYLIITFLVAVFILLDGFDLGAGGFYFFIKEESEKKILISSIGPLWDGNEVWLIAVGGALFAAFPKAYASLLSGFYLPVICLVFCLIFRAISLEFRNKTDSRRQQKFLDRMFSTASITAIFIFGLLLGNLLKGLPLNENQEVYISVLDLLNPYAIVLGFTSIFLLVIHGLLFIILKTENSLQEKAREWIPKSLICFSLSMVVAITMTLVFYPEAVKRFNEHPALYILFVPIFISLIGIYLNIKAKKDNRAFMHSSLIIVLSLGIASLSLYPNLIYSPTLPDYTLTIYSAASSLKTLKIISILGLIGLPIAIFSSVCLYKTFRGKIN